jgi:hypothetical protein
VPVVVLPPLAQAADDPAGSGPPSSPSTAIGPTGTAPGLSFVEQPEPALDDSSGTTTFGWPMGFAMFFLLAVVVVIVVRARRGAAAPHPPATPHRAGDEPRDQFPDGSRG